MEDIGEIFARDHRRLEEALNASTAYVGTAQWDAAAAAFAEFRRGIEQHMEIEEQELFPAVERGGGETALTAVLRKGHRDLRVFFDELDDALEAHDVEELAASLAPCVRCSPGMMRRRKRNSIPRHKRSLVSTQRQ